jgi:hypothetical protein
MNRNDYQLWIAAAVMTLGNDHPLVQAMKRALHVAAPSDLTRAAEQMEALRRVNPAEYRRLIEIHRSMTAPA